MFNFISLNIIVFFKKKTKRIMNIIPLSLSLCICCKSIKGALIFFLFQCYSSKKTGSIQRVRKISVNR